MRVGDARTLGIVLCALVMAGGCRTATRVKEVPRVDVQVEGLGNRGYLLGTAPPPGEIKTTRQMLETDVEIPSFYKPTVSRHPVTLEGEAPVESEASVSEGLPERYDTYTVQKGESLWSIAARPEVYGRATHWRRLFDANRDVLKSPDQLKAGMTLKIPRGEGTDTSHTEDEGTTFKK